MNIALNNFSDKVVSWTGWLLLISVLGFYSYGIGEAIHLTCADNSEKYPDALSTAMGSIQALLLTNLGVLLGISVATPSSGVARSLKLNFSEESTDASSPLELKDKVQLLAMLIYVVSLVACVVTWVVKVLPHKEPNEVGNVVALINESAKMFIGVALAYLTAVLRK
jgi:hypothetical protein